MTDSDDLASRVRLRQLRVLSDNHYVLRRADLEYRRGDGAWQSQMRESYDVGDAAAVLPWDRSNDSIVLIKQFRWPVFEWGYRQLLIEVIAGKLDGNDPKTCIAREAMEEAGITIANPQLVSHCFVSPGAVKERTSLFLAEYDHLGPREKGGGHEGEGEDIQVLEMRLDEGLAMIARGDIIDMKTILLLQAAKLKSYDH